MASKKSEKSNKGHKGFAPKEPEEKFAGAVQKARQPAEPPMDESPAEVRMTERSKLSPRKNNSDNPFVKRNG